MRVARAIIPLPTPHTDLSTEPATELATGDVGMGQQPEGPPIRRLKLVFKQPRPTRPTREMRPAPAISTLARTSRTGRVIKAPTAFAPAPSAVPEKRKPGPRKKKEANIVCVHCGRGNSPSTNQIVFCDGCNATWHQKCHDPPIPDNVIEVKDMEWFCSSCKPATKPAVKKAKEEMKPKKPASKIQQQPRQPPGLDVGGNQFTTDEQRAYLAAQSHTQLVELVVEIATNNPNVPIFPANLRELPSSQFAPAPAPVNTTSRSSSIPGPSSTTKSKKRGRAVSAAAADDQVEKEPACPTKRSRTTSAPAKPAATQTTMAKTKSAATTRKTSAPASRPSSSKSPKTTLSSSASRRQSTSAEPALSRASSPKELELETDEDDFYEIPDHRLYPRAGNGFSPPSDPAALSILDEDPESKTFSHQLHVPAKKTKNVKAAKKIA